MMYARLKQAPQLAKALFFAAGLAVLCPSIAGSQAPPPGAGPPRGFAATFYAENCAGCHGANLEGGRGPSLSDPARLTARTDDQLHATILNGVSGAEMPAFKGRVDDNQTWQLVAFLRTQAATIQGKPAFVPDPNGKVIRSAKQTFRIETVAAGLDTPWGMTFLPDGRMLVTERSGAVRIIDRTGKLQPNPVWGTPQPWVRQDSGTLDIALHPDYRRNGWIYLAYTDMPPGTVVPTAPPAAPGQPAARPASPPSMTVVVRGRLSAKGEWINQQEIFRAPFSLYTPSGAHYGARFVFDRQGHLFFGIGERGDMANAQKLDNPLGKIHRVNADGSVPRDNPFVNTPGAVPTIWSYGHRNPEGLSFDPVTGLLWESEHGPTGGDEINVIEKGKNYGWGVISMGVQPGITQRSAPGMEQPIVYYTPTMAPSGINFYVGSRYPGWRNNLFVAALAGQQLRRLEIKGRAVVAQEPLFEAFGRTRQVITGPDGLLYVLLQNPTGAGTGLSLSAATPGMVIRLVPVR
jgi:glucose/arabinose dehydrogenase